MRKYEIFWAIACSALVAGVSLGVDMRTISEDGPTAAITNSTAVSDTTNSVPVKGWVDAVAIDYTMVTNAYIVTNGATASDPDIQGGYFYNGAFGTSTQSFLEDGGVYDLWFTNGTWYIGATRGTTTVSWTGKTVNVTGMYVNASAACTGIVELGTLYADFDVDVLTSSGQGIGISQTLYTADDVDQTDIIKYVRGSTHTTAGVEIVDTNATRLVLVEDLIVLRLYDSIATGITAKAKVILSPTP